MREIDLVIKIHIDDSKLFQKDNILYINALFHKIIIKLVPIPNN
jgi:hypothetical protein